MCITGITYLAEILGFIQIGHLSPFVIPATKATILILSVIFTLGNHF